MCIRDRAQADVIVSVLPATRETRHLFTAERFSHCKPGAIFFNVGRGNAVHEGELLAALQAGKPAMAVLDVFEQEPLPADSPLWHQPNLIVTPHNSAYSFPEDVAQKMCIRDSSRPMPVSTDGRGSGSMVPSA